MADLKPFDRPELTEQQIESARVQGLKITYGKGVPQLRGLCIALCMENMRLAMEVNGHRAALDLEPLPVFEVK